MFQLSGFYCKAVGLGFQGSEIGDLGLVFGV